jgi:hypothetical protein
MVRQIQEELVSREPRQESLEESLEENLGGETWARKFRQENVGKKKLGKKT